MLKKNRLITAILTISLIASLLSVTAFSAEVQPSEQEIQQEIQQEIPQEIQPEDSARNEEPLEEEDSVQDEQPLEEQQENNIPAPEDISVSGSISLVEDIDFNNEDSDYLYEQHVNRLFYGSPGSGVKLRGSKSAGDRLTGAEKVIYSRLKERAASVADGYEASSMVSIPLTELGIVPSEDFLFTAEELGLEYIYKYPEGTWNPELGAVIRELFSFDLIKIRDCLIADCPYECYWTNGIHTKNNITYTAPHDSEYVDGEWVYTFYLKLTITDYFAGFRVEDKYQDKTDPDGLTADRDKTGAAAEAVSNANDILDEAAGLASDYDKLVFYKDRICTLVKYDGNAAENLNQEDRGPWALVYVFDGNKNTNVVCEGYAKAFQYLCDRTAFNDPDVCAYSVTGNMGNNFNTEGEGHKWNIVHMDDGRNYIADVTNSDAGTWGANGELFLKGMTKDGDNTYIKTDESGYVFYTYDSHTLAIFTEQELALSNTNYSASDTADVDNIADMHSVNLMLTDKIGLRVHVNIDTYHVSDSDYIEFQDADGGTLLQKTVGNADSTEETAGRYKEVVFELPLYAAEMTDNITFFMVVGGVEGTPVQNYSVRTYADAILNDTEGIYSDEEKAMVKAMLHYGSFTQQYFGHNTEALADDSIGAFNTEAPNLENYAYSYSKGRGEQDFDLVYATLYLDTDVSVRFYYTSAFGGNIENQYTISLKDDDGRNVPFVIEYSQSRDMWYIMIENIKPLDLGKIYDLTIKNKSNVNARTNLRYGPLSYCNSMLTDSTADSKIKNLCISIYRYYEAAAGYTSVQQK